jgi:Uma2 family endonuclease
MRGTSKCRQHEALRGRIISREHATVVVVSDARIEIWNPAVSVKLAPVLSLDDSQLFDFCQLNRDLRIERDADGVLVLMAPVGGASSVRNSELARQLGNWANRDGSGIAFDSSVGFILPNGALRSPDASWVSKERWAELTVGEREKFPPLCPDFVVELRSPSDRLATLQQRMRELMRNGAQLGWLIDPRRGAVLVYKPGEPVQTLVGPSAISADPVLPGFVLDLGPILRS